MNKLGVFIIGSALGAGAALLAAPRPGDETRAIVTDWASNAMGDKNEYTTRLQVRGEQITHDAGVIANQAAALAQSGFQKAKEGVGNVQVPTPSFGGGAKKEPAAAPADDELRERINQARERIAKQVAENAAAAREAAGGTIPSVQDAAKDVAARVKETAAAAGGAAKGE